MTSLADASNAIRHVWRAGGATYGAWCSIPDSFSAEILGRVGFDWACIDLQHGLAAGDSYVSMMQALSATATPTFVRVPWNGPAAIMRALDLGAVGVIVPMINNAAEAEAAVQACRYAPRGSRSYGPTRAAIISGELPTDEVNGLVLLAVMVETRAALDQIDDILAVDGIDAVFVGPADLRVSLGMRDTNNPAFLDELSRIVAAGRKHGIVPGIFCPTTDLAVAWRDLGYQMLAVESDVRLLRRAASEALAAVRRLPVDTTETTASSGYV
jgi:4-hydroxy-2-oxoheptanedioate aldolase